jgi:hypothetical protein
MSSRPLILALSALLTPWLTAGCYMVPPGDDKDVLDSRAREVPACDTPVDEQLLADQLWQLINLERTGAGVAPVALSEALTSVAAGSSAITTRSRATGPVGGRWPSDTSSTRSARTSPPVSKPPSR